MQSYHAIKMQKLHFKMIVIIILQEKQQQQAQDHLIEICMPTIT